MQAEGGQTDELIVRCCPICGEKVDVYFEIDAAEPFTANDLREGLMVWGPYSADKETICQKGQFVHFKFGDIETRLVKMTGA